MKARWTATVAAVGLCVAAPGVASAHLVATGMGPVYDGGLHVLTSPPEILTTAALGMLAGLLGPKFARAALASVLFGWFVAGLLPSAGVEVGRYSGFAAAVGLMASGGLLAAHARPGFPLATGLVAVLAFLGALDAYGQGYGATTDNPYVGLAGAALAAVVVCALGAAASLRFGAGWRVYIFRVAGAWIAALGLLLAGWSLRAPGIAS